ncbi:MAG: hypothetical protein CEE38_19030 [Planctomycetes bacterium B3_Pla]|nr:MAG: hypothetical protein CEE38_19030 [Planctomycetes bacterium B3_Pla]
MEITLLISLTAVIVSVAAYLRWSRTNKENRRLRNIKLKDETLTLTTELLMLQHELQNKLGVDFLEELKANMDEETFASVIEEVQWLTMQEQIISTGREILFALESDFDPVNVEIIYKHNQMILTQTRELANGLELLMS